VIPAAIVVAYLAIVVYIGVFAFRRAHGREEVEDYFLAGRSLGPFVFLMSLFGTNMTAFTILGSSGHAFANGIVTFGLMASSSAFVIPLTLFLVGTRVWALGKRHGFITPVQLFRDRWETSHIGTAIFAVQAALLVPYIVIGVMGGGTTLEAVSGGRVPYWLGGALVALVVMTYVFFGGMRGTAWVNTFQTTLFLVFGGAALLVIGWGMGGFGRAADAILASGQSFLLTRERVSPLYFLSYTFIPLSSIAFPHITIFCLTARRMAQVRKTVVLYPLCIAAIWLPCVFLGVMANRAGDVPAVHDKLEARRALATEAASLAPEARAALRARAAGDDVIVLLLDHYAPVWLAGILGAGIMAAVMATDSQILALSTMFTEDVFAHYRGEARSEAGSTPAERRGALGGAAQHPPGQKKARFGEAAQVHTGRAFVIGLTAVAYVVALRLPEGIFAIAVQYAFTGFAALAPLLLAALFWRGSTKWGALASTLWVAAGVVGIAAFNATIPPPPAGQATAVWSVAGLDVLARTSGGLSVLGLLPVVPMVLVSALLMLVVSALTPKPSAGTVARYFPC
jgi:SSS family solute:Na+ symporter